VAVRSRGRRSARHARRRREPGRPRTMCRTTRVLEGRAGADARPPDRRFTMAIGSRGARLPPPDSGNRSRERIFTKNPEHDYRSERRGERDPAPTGKVTRRRRPITQQNATQYRLSGPWARSDNPRLMGRTWAMDCKRESSMEPEKDHMSTTPPNTRAGGHRAARSGRIDERGAAARGCWHRPIAPPAATRVGPLGLLGLATVVVAAAVVMAARDRSAAAVRARV
jgi:hypothetical protein